MNDELKAIWLSFFNWVMGNGPRPENEVIPPDPPPALPFSQRPKDKYSRFHEMTLKERYNQWLEIHGLHLFSMLYAALSVLACIVIVALLLFTVSELPPFGDDHNPANNEVIRRYVQHGARETGAQNITAGVMHSYRAYDRFGESAVLFTAAMCVLMLLGASRRGTNPEELSPHGSISGYDFLQRGPPVSVHAIFLFGIYLVISGHLSPGGGFSGGALISTALILCGVSRVHSFLHERTYILAVSSSIIVYTLLEAYSVFTGANQIDSLIPKGITGNILSGGLILPVNICVGVLSACVLYGFYALFTEEDI